MFYELILLILPIERGRRTDREAGARRAAASAGSTPAAPTAAGAASATSGCCIARDRQS